MSGFFGMLREDGATVEERLLSAIGEELRLRGPEGVSVWSQAGVGGCFALMRKGPARQVDEQPVEACGRFRLWGDIRVDARERLRERLLEEGCHLGPDPSSEELFLQAWRFWGEGALQEVIGDFSLALWDAQEQALWCARDFVGARPFYYANTSGFFCFSNTLEILLRVPEVSRELDEAYVGDFLLEGWNVEPSRTVYRNIRRLPAGHVLKFSRGRAETRRFRKLPVEEPLRLARPEEYVEQYVEVLQAAVSDRLPQGATALYLSGGLDSSSVSALAAELAAARGQKELLKAFTVSWKPLLDDPEPQFAEITAKHLDIAHEILQDAETAPFERGECGVQMPPEPTLDIFFAREQRQYRRIAEHSNVVLSGDGGDDVLIGQAWPYLVHLFKRGEWTRWAGEFGGYAWRHKRLPPMHGGFRTRMRRLLWRDQEDMQYPMWLNENFEARTKLRERWRELKAAKPQQEHPVHPRAYGALHDGYWSRVLETEDAGWTGVNLESRAALLDLRVLRYFLRLPAVPWCVEKQICRVAMRKSLPKSIVERPKTPLVRDVLEALPLETWQGHLRRAASDRLKAFVNWDKFCETLSAPKGSLSWLELRPLSLLKWLESH